jgi:hypothetical protein
MLVTVEPQNHPPRSEPAHYLLPVLCVTTDRVNLTLLPILQSAGPVIKLQICLRWYGRCVYSGRSLFHLTLRRSVCFPYVSSPLPLLSAITDFKSSESSLDSRPVTRYSISAASRLVHLTRGHNDASNLGFRSQGDAMGEVQVFIHVQPSLPSAAYKDDRLPNRHDSLRSFGIRGNCRVIRYFLRSPFCRKEKPPDSSSYQIMSNSKMGFRLKIPELTYITTTSSVSHHIIFSLGLLWRRFLDPASSLICSGRRGRRVSPLDLRGR